MINRFIHDLLSEINDSNKLEIQNKILKQLPVIATDMLDYLYSGIITTYPDIKKICSENTREIHHDYFKIKITFYKYLNHNRNRFKIKIYDKNNALKAEHRLHVTCIYIDDFYIKLILNDIQSEIFQK